MAGDDVAIVDQVERIEGHFLGLGGKAGDQVGPEHRVRPPPPDSLMAWPVRISVWIAAGAVIVAGLANVARIRAQQPGGGSGGGGVAGGGSGGGASAAPATSSQSAQLLLPTQGQPYAPAPVVNVGAPNYTVISEGDGVEGWGRDDVAFAVACDDDPEHAFAAVDLEGLPCGLGPAVPASALEPGTHPLRVMKRSGMCNGPRFAIDTLPESGQRWWRRQRNPA